MNQFRTFSRKKCPELIYCYSVLILFTGFSLAFFQLCTVIVVIVMSVTSRNDKMNIHGVTGVFSANPCSQCCPIHHPNGAATMKHPVSISIYLRLNMYRICLVELPIIFLIPISFLLYSLSNMVSPNTPVRLMAIAMSEKSRICLVKRSSFR